MTAPRRTKSLSQKANETARAILRRIVADEFGGNMKAAAKAMGISYSLFYEFHEGISKAGLKTIEAIADYTGKSLDEVTGREPSAPHVEYEREPGIATNALGNHRMWRAVRAEVMRRYGRLIDESALAEVAAITMSGMPEILSAQLVKSFHDAIVEDRARQQEAEKR